MRCFWIIVVGLSLSGCASEQAPTEVASPPAIVEASNPHPSAALAFDPPMIQNIPTLDLARTGLGEAAFAGFQDTTTSYFDIWTDNRQASDGSDRFYREGYVESVGSITR